MTPEQARDAGIALRENAADPRWIAIVDAIIQRWARSGRKFSANTIRDEVPVAARDLAGGRILSALNRKDIKRVGYVKSSLVSTHSKPIGEYVGIEFATEGSEVA